jgi:hypothetical protein
MPFLGAEPDSPLLTEILSVAEKRNLRRRCAKKDDHPSIKPATVWGAGKFAQPAKKI